VCRRQAAEERAHIDADVEDRIGAVAPMVAWVEILGLKAPLPRMSVKSASRNSGSNAIMK
jgi:hypothetical protein